MLADATNCVWWANTVAFLQIFMLKQENPGFRLIISIRVFNLMETSQSWNDKRENATTCWYLTGMTTDSHIWAGGTGSCLVFHALVQQWRGRQGKLFLETLTSPRRLSGTLNPQHGPRSHYSCSLILSLSLAELLLLKQVLHLFIAHGSLALLLHRCVGWLRYAQVLHWRITTQREITSYSELRMQWRGR